MRFNIIGAGRLGLHLAHAIQHHGLGELAGVYNRDLTHAQAAVQLVGSGCAVTSIAALPSAPLTFITTPDDAIASVAHALASNSLIQAGDMVVHCSGVLGSDILSSLQANGVLTASIHPAKAFCAHAIHPAIFQGCYCVVEGEPQSVALLMDLFTALGAAVHAIETEKKTNYHAAAVMASNYIVTLARCARQLFHEAGLEDGLAEGMTQQLLQTSLTNISHASSLSEALTGPLMRGDVLTIAKHIHAIKDPVINGLYRAAGLATLPLTRFNADNRVQMAGLLTATNTPSL